MPQEQTLDFNTWIEQLKTVVVESELSEDGKAWYLEIINPDNLDCWREYYSDGYTPYQAFREDLSYAD